MKKSHQTALYQTMSFLSVSGRKSPGGIVNGK